MKGLVWRKRGRDGERVCPKWTDRVAYSSGLVNYTHCLTQPSLHKNSESSTPTYIPYGHHPSSTLRSFAAFSYPFTGRVSSTAATMQSAYDQPYPPPTSTHNRSNPIDLTLDDDPDDSYVNERACKRTCPQSRSFDAVNAACPDSAANQYTNNSAPAPPSQHYHSGLSPAMSHSSLQPEMSLPPPPAPTYSSPPRPYLPPPTPQQLQQHQQQQYFHPNPHPPYPSYPAPSHSNLHSSRPIASAPNANSIYMPQPSTSRTYSSSPPQAGPSNSNGGSRQVIDLTTSPSPPPQQAPPSQPNQPCPLTELQDVTPVCIGLLTVTALVLYPIPYLCQQPPAGVLDPEWARVRLQYDNNANRPGGQPTIHIRAPTMALPNGQQVPGENFAVVEQKVASSIGSLMAKGLIRLDAKVRRDRPNVRSLPPSQIKAVNLTGRESCPYFPFSSSCIPPKRISLLLHIISKFMASCLIIRHSNPISRNSTFRGSIITTLTTLPLAALHALARPG